MLKSPCSDSQALVRPTVISGRHLRTHSHADWQGLMDERGEIPPG